MRGDLTRIWIRPLAILTERQFRLRAKRSHLSAVWPLFVPFSLTLLYSFLFKRVFDVPIPDYPVFLLCGLLPWSFLTQTLGKTITSITSDPELLRSMRVRAELIPLSGVVVHAVMFLVATSGFVLFLGLTGRLRVGLLPALIFPLIALVLLLAGLSLVVALVDVYNRDLRMVLGNILLVWFFLIPIVYRRGMAPPGLAFLTSVDPMNLIVGQFRAVLYYRQIREPGHLVLMLGVCVALFLLCVAVFRRYSKHLAEDV